MSETELLDSLDEQGRVIGQASRNEFHSNPDLIHGVVHCWIFNSNGDVLWQKRSKQKATSPGKWDMSCGGHILSGSNPDNTLAKELEEELGVKNLNTNLVERYIIKGESQTEMVYLYYAVADLSPEELTLQEDEVEKVEWIDPSKAQALVIEGRRDSTDYIFHQVTKILKYISFNNET